MINAVLASFPRFHVTFVIKRLLYVEIWVFRKKKRKKKRELEVQKGQSGLLPILSFLLQQRFLGSCRDNECSVAAGVGLGKVFWVATRNSGSRQSLLAMCRDMVFRLQMAPRS